jgi:hypothetical protein
MDDDGTSRLIFLGVNLNFYFPALQLYAGKKDIGISDLNDYSPKFLSDLLESDIYTYELPNTAHEWRVGNVHYCYHIRARINFYRYA